MTICSILGVISREFVRNTDYYISYIARSGTASKDNHII